MEYKDLNNYGKSFPEIFRAIPPKVNKKIIKISMGIVQKYLGLEKMKDFLNQISKERENLIEKDLTEIRAYCKDEKFIKSMIESSAIFSALAKLVEDKEALDIHLEIMDNVMPILGSLMFPSPEAFLSFEDPLEAFKKFMITLMDADQKVGVHDYEVIEDTADAFQINIIKCAYYEIPKQLGVPMATLANCYADDVFLPEAGKKAGIKFIRTGTLARGNRVCDFRFEKV